MIDRSYLPYQSARDFQDRGMAKWAGFFLSEHSTALQTNQLSLEELRLLSNQESVTSSSRLINKRLPSPSLPSRTIESPSTTARSIP